jgi:flagellar hook-associated protein 3 FlgL
MRVTENMFTKTFLMNVNNTRARMSKLQEQIATGRRVLTASDDPAAAERILRLKNAIGRNDQFQKNVEDGQAMMQATENALSRFTDLMIEAKDILTRARSGGRTSELRTLADELDRLLTDAVQTANTRFNGKYLFGGVQTTDPPFILAPDRSSVTVNPNGITGTIEVMVNEGVLQAINIDGQQAFQGATMFQELITIRDAMRNGTPPTAEQFDTVDGFVKYVSSQAGRAGQMLQSLDLHQEMLAKQADHLAALLSADEDTDFAEASLLLKKEELMLDAALSTGARLLPKSLLDFLK